MFQLKTFFFKKLIYKCISLIDTAPSQSRLFYLRIHSRRPCVRHRQTRWSFLNESRATRTHEGDDLLRTAWELKSKTRSLLRPYLKNLKGYFLRKIHSAHCCLVVSLDDCKIGILIQPHVFLLWFQSCSSTGHPCFSGL